MRKIIGIGHSHLHAVTAALREFETRHPGNITYRAMCLVDKPYHPPFTVEDGEEVANPIWIEDMRNHISGSDDYVFFCLGGSEYWRFSLIPGPKPFDFIDPIEDDGLPLVGQLLPYDLFMRQLASTFSFFASYVRAVRRIAPVRLVQFLPPPPVFDLLGAVEPKHLEQFHSVTKEYPISPPAFRLKVWRACALAMSEACINLGVECPPTPVESLTAAGFLRDQLISDTIHGNIAWGRLLSRQILGDLSKFEDAG